MWRGGENLPPPLETALGNLSGQLNCRILEAEDLEQADLLSRIWHPNVVLLDSGGRDIPMAYLRQLSACRPVAALPLIVLDAQVAQAAHELGVANRISLLDRDRGQSSRGSLVRNSGGCRHRALSCRCSSPYLDR